MESKGRRSARAAGPAETPAENSIASPKPDDTHSDTSEPRKIVEHFAAPASAVPESPGAVATSNGTASAEIADFRRETFAAFALSQAALARGLEALSAEMAVLALSGIDTVARTASRMLGIKTVSDAIEVNAGFTRSSFDALVSVSARLSELGVKLAAETSQPLINQFGKAWSKSARRGFCTAPLGRPPVIPPWPEMTGSGGQ
jgi:hypothetical protein